MTKPNDSIDPGVLALARTALAKRKAGQKLTREETRALDRVQRDEEEKARRRYYATIPKGHWVELSGRQHKILDEQARRYGIPIGGKTIDLAEVAKWIHNVIAEHGRKLFKADSDEDLLYGTDGSPAMERYREEMFRIRRLDRREREGSLVPRARVHDGLSQLAALLRGLGEDLKRQYGNDALELLNDRLDQFEALADQLFAKPDPEDPDPDNPPADDGRPGKSEPA